MEWRGQSRDQVSGTCWVTGGHCFLGRADHWLLSRWFAVLDSAGAHLTGTELEPKCWVSPHLQDFGASLVWQGEDLEPFVLEHFSMFFHCRGRCFRDLNTRALRIGGCVTGSVPQLKNVLSSFSH